MATGLDVVRMARTWLGTPYHHQGRVKGAGVDCGGLVIGVARFLMIGFGAESLVLLLFAQILHAATFGVHHSASVATLQRWFG